MKYTRYCRSLLSTPASVVERYEKGHRAGADICVLDLEDSVPAADKGWARRRAEEFFTAPSAAATRCGLRINGVTEPDGLHDLLALQQYDVKPSVVVIPKAESARDVEIVEQILGRACPDVEFFAVVETPRGVENAAEIASASRRLRALIFGAADYSFAVGAQLSWVALVHARARVVNSARAANIEVIDSPLFDLTDVEGLRCEAQMGRDLGFSGKIAIHPRHVAVINEVFSPTPSTLERARRVVAAGQDYGLNIAVVDGAMVGLPFFEASRRLIEEFGAPGQPAPSAARGEEA